MEDQLLRRINGLEAEFAALREMMGVSENGRPKAKPNASRTYRREISRRTVLGLIVIATFLLLDGTLQSQQNSDDALFIDSSGRVGIGTDQPMAPLEVRAPAGSTAAIRFGDASGRAGLVAGGGYFGLRDQADSDRLSILQSNGYVGIGTTQPTAPLEVRAPAGSAAAIRFGDASGHAGLVAGGGYFGLRDKADKDRLSILQSNGNVGIGILDPKSKLEVMGDAVIYGKITHSGRLQIDDLPEHTYQISPRYHLSLSGRAYGGRTKTIPHHTLMALCADPDGCQVRLAMTRWSANTQTESASVFFTFYYSQTGDGHWRASATDAGNASGIDGDGTIKHVRNIWDTCYFTDGIYANYKQVDDKTQGMQLLVWNGYKNADRTCELTLID